jgi:hypothetical protein
MLEPEFKNASPNRRRADESNDSVELQCDHGIGNAAPAAIVKLRR